MNQPERLENKRRASSCSTTTQQTDDSVIYNDNSLSLSSTPQTRPVSIHDVMNCEANEDLFTPISTFNQFDEKLHPQYELGDSFTPLRYDCHFNFGPETIESAVIEGIVKIDTVCHEYSDCISLHVDPEWVLVREGFIVRLASQHDGELVKEIGKDNFSLNNGIEGHLMQIHLPKLYLIPGDYVSIVLFFSTKVCQDAKGIYHYEIQDPLKAVCGGIATALEPLFARRVLPCFDCPHYKTRFSLRISFSDTLRNSLQHRLKHSDQILYSYNALSVANAANKQRYVPLSCISTGEVKEMMHEKAPVISQEILNILLTHKKMDKHRLFPLTLHPECFHHTVVFDETPQLPIYCIGLFLGDLIPTHSYAVRFNKAASVDAVPALPVRISSWNTAGTPTKLVNLAICAATDAFAFLSSLFDNVGYPLNKVDLIALPKSRGIGLENFGCISFDQEYFLVSNHTPALRQIRTCRLIIHELIHLWFGDIVTPQSFDELWLKEGVARYLEFVGLENIQRGAHVWAYFAADVYFEAMVWDTGVLLNQCHPVQLHCLRFTDEICSHFNCLTYGKAACLLRMLESFFGWDFMLRGLRRSLEQHQYSTVTSEQMFAAFQQSLTLDANKTIKMPNQMAIPEHHISIQNLMNNWIHMEGFPMLDLKLMRQENGKWQLHLAQSPVNNSKGTIWTIPLRIIVNGESLRFVLNEVAATFELPCETTEAPSLVPNPNGAGFFWLRLGNSFAEEGFQKALQGSAVHLSEVIGTVSGYLCGVLAEDKCGETISQFFSFLFQVCHTIGTGSFRFRQQSNVSCSHRMFNTQHLCKDFIGPTEFMLHICVGILQAAESCFIHHMNNYTIAKLARDPIFDWMRSILCRYLTQRVTMNKINLSTLRIFRGATVIFEECVERIVTKGNSRSS